MSSRITIQLDHQLEPAAYARLVHVLSAALVLGGYRAEVEIDGTATVRDLEGELEKLVETVIKGNPYGW